MVNVKLLEGYITDSGLNVSDIANSLCISEKTFLYKKNNILDFKISEIYILCNILCIKKNPSEVFFS